MAIFSILSPYTPLATISNLCSDLGIHVVIQLSTPNVPLPYTFYYILILLITVVYFLLSTFAILSKFYLTLAIIFINAGSLEPKSFNIAYFTVNVVHNGPGVNKRS